MNATPSAHLAAVLERRISRLNREFSVHRQRGLASDPFIRRARALSRVWLEMKEALPHRPA